ncbi:hypothetical protein MMC32_008418 [Xylographa parallela]|nr:hypothetical protein [Xylographa parallela]
MSAPSGKPGKPLGAYVSNGQVLTSPPLAVRFRGFVDNTILFLGLYITTLFSLDPYAAGQTSAYNINNRERDGTRTGRGFFGGGGGGGGGGSGGGGPGPGSGGGGGRKLGTVDQIRGAEYTSGGGTQNPARTQEEWVMIIDNITRNLPDTYQTYQAPKAGTVEFAKYIDHTLLKLDATEEQIDQLCQEAKEYNFKSVCVRVNHVARCIQNLQGTSVLVACVVGFHEGSYSTDEKVNEALLALHHGATELDIVLHHALLPPSTPSPSYPPIFAELATLRSTCPPPAVLKLILETAQLSRGAIAAACVLAAHAGFDFVKTSTGFNGPGATVEDVRVMRAVVEAVAGGRVQVKASGGVRTVEACGRMMEAGAGRIGTSSGVALMEEGRGVVVEGRAGGGY